MNNNHNRAQPPPNSLSGQLSIQDLMGIYGFLATINNPSAKILEAKDNMENIILQFSQSLGAINHEQTRQ